MATDVPIRMSTSPRQAATDEWPSLLTTRSEFYSLLDSVDSETIDSDFELDRHSERHDFTEHVKIANYEGLEDSDSLKSLAQKTDTHAGIESISASHFSRLTNNHDYRAVVELLSEMLHTPQLHHQLGCERKRFERLEDQIVAIDTSHSPQHVVIQGSFGYNRSRWLFLATSCFTGYQVLYPDVVRWYLKGWWMIYFQLHRLCNEAISRFVSPVSFATVIFQPIVDAPPIRALSSD